MQRDLNLIYASGNRGVAQAVSTRGNLSRVKRKGCKFINREMFFFRSLKAEHPSESKTISMLVYMYSWRTRSLF